MKSKMIFFALAMSMSSALVARADDFPKPVPQQRQAPLNNPQEGYDEAPDEGLDPAYRSPGRDCGSNCGGGGGREVVSERYEERYEEGYAGGGGGNCGGPRCGPPQILPIPGHGGPGHGFPYPLPGPCQIVPNVHGWTIVRNGNEVIQTGRRYDARNIPILRINFVNAGICTVFLN